MWKEMKVMDQKVYHVSVSSIQGLLQWPPLFCNSERLASSTNILLALFDLEE